MRWLWCVVFGLGLALLPACHNAARPALPSSAPLGVTASRFVPGSADPERKAKLVAAAPLLDSLFREKLVQSGATGAAVGVVLEGELVYARSFGVRDVISQRPIDADTVFRIASLTKSFTALAVLQLRDEGKLGLDEPVTRYVPELGGLAPPTRDAPPLSARLLLTNASGLGYDDLWGSETFGQTDAELFSLVRDGAAFSSAPGTHYAYSNLGWALLGQLVTRVSGKPYRDYVTTRILDPLGMSSTVWDAREVAAGRLATGYLRAGEQLITEPHPTDGAFAPAGGLYTSLRDYARYVAFQLSAYPPRDDPESGPVRRSTLREMHQGQRWARAADKDAPVARRSHDGLALRAAAYGFGWLNVTTCNEEERVQHGGFEPGYFATSLLLPQQRLGLIVLATSAPLGAQSHERALKILRDAGVVTRSRATPHPMLVTARDTITRLLVNWDPVLAKRLFDPDGLKYSWNTHLLEDLSKLGATHGACRPDGDLTTYDPLHGEWRLSCARGAITFDTLLTPRLPPSVQALSWREEFPAGERAQRAAEQLTSLIAHWDARTARELLANQLDPTPLQRDVARAALEYGACQVEQGVLALDHAPLVDSRARASFPLRCERGTLTASFIVDEASGQIDDLNLAPPSDPQALCWP
ncbi:MAG TPA: serine hydrolase domain-containing protein [Polyangiaceae bacterium]